MKIICPHCNRVIERKRPDNSQRDSHIFWRRLDGKSFQDLGKEYNISASRVRQIFDRKLRSVIWRLGDDSPLLPKGKYYNYSLSYWQEHKEIFTGL